MWLLCLLIVLLFIVTLMGLCLIYRYHADETGYHPVVMVTAAAEMGVL
jgi:hypothetical protein